MLSLQLNSDPSLVQDGVPDIFTLSLASVKVGLQPCSVKISNGQLFHGRGLLLARVASKSQSNCRQIATKIACSLLERFEVAHEDAAKIALKLPM